jgi:adenylate cyclase class IV
MRREIELKSVVTDVEDRRRRLEAAGARMEFDGTLEDRKYDTSDGRLAAADQVLRVRTFTDERGGGAALEWKGPTRYEDGYKVRDEITANISDPAPVAAILERLGYAVIGEIDRRVAQYAYDGAVIRFEQYPRMDRLVEVEGPPDAIERAIDALGMDRDGFSADRLPAFMARFERRTGTRAAVNQRQLGATGDATGAPTREVIDGG